MMGHGMERRCWRASHGHSFTSSYLARPYTDARRFWLTY